MAVLVTLSLFVVLLLSIVSLFLYLDARGQRHALRAATEALAIVQQQTAEHDRQLAAVARAMAVVTRPPAAEEEIKPPLAVRIGDEILELDAETSARIDALAEDLNSGRYDGALLQRVIEAGFDELSAEAPVSGEVPVKSGDCESEESNEEASAVESELAFPELAGSRDPIPPPVTPTNPSHRY